MQRNHTWQTQHESHAVTSQKVYLSLLPIKLVLQSCIKVMDKKGDGIQHLSKKFGFEKSNAKLKEVFSVGPEIRELLCY